MALSHDEISRIAVSVAEDVFGASRPYTLDISAGPDWAGKVAYFIEFTLEQDRDRDLALDKRLRLRGSIRDRLFDAGDETYPYVRVLNRSSAPAIG